MRSRFGILMLAVSASLLLAGCGKKGIIPAKTMAQIYSEFFLMDDWSAVEYSVGRKADTTLVYEPILNKYGYTTQDYRNTVMAYLEDPEEFAKIVLRAKRIVDKDLAAITREIDLKRASEGASSDSEKKLDEEKDEEMILEKVVPERSLRKRK